MIKLKPEVASPIDYPERRCYKFTFRKTETEKEKLKRIRNRWKKDIKKDFPNKPVNKVLNPKKLNLID